MSSYDDHLPDPPAEFFAVMDRIHQHAKIMPNPSPNRVGKILVELALLGIEDTQTFRGLPNASSSARQYALAAASLAEHPEDAARVFITVHPGILRHALTLEARYALKPVNARTFLEEQSQSHDGKDPPTSNAP